MPQDKLNDMLDGFENVFTPNEESESDIPFCVENTTLDRWMVEKYYRHADYMAGLNPCPIPDINRKWSDENE